MMKDSLCAFAFMLLIMALAVALTYAEDWARAENRPEWLLFGFHGISILLFITDGIAIAGLCAKLILHSVRDVFRWKDEE